MSTEYVTAEHVPAELRLMAHTGVIHVRSRFTRHWDGIGTPMCNDGRMAAGESRASVARAFDTSPANVWGIVIRRYWKHVD
jgi:hypothetical protein